MSHARCAAIIAVWTLAISGLLRLNTHALDPIRFSRRRALMRGAGGRRMGGAMSAHQRARRPAAALSRICKNFV